MLPTRIPHRLLVLAVFTFMCLVIVSSNAQNPPRRSCRNTLSFLEASGQNQVTKNEIYDNLKDETLTSGVCKLDKTCCSGSAELTFKTMTSGDYKQKIQTMLMNALMPCHNHTFLGEFITFIRASKVNLVARMKAIFLAYFNPYVSIFDEFYGYLETGVKTGNLCEIEEKFTKVSFELFLAAYVVSSSLDVNSRPLPNTDVFRHCFYNFFLDLRGDMVSTRLHGFLRAYNLTMRYVRALKMVENVIEAVLDLPLTDQCRDALMKMTYCSQCAGYNAHLLPCQGLCMNSLRGCLVDFADLVEPIREMTQALVELNRILNDVHNPWDQITTLNSYFFRTVTDTQQDFANIQTNLFTWCDADGPRNRNKRSSPAAAVPVPANHENRENIRERRMIAERAAPTPPFAAMNQSSHCLAGALPVFTTMAEGVCSRGDISQANANCWTGLTFGSYERTIIDLDRSAQKNNPELVVCTKRSRLRKQVAQLHFITRELNIVSGAQSCSSDDEDCIDSVPHTCNYFQFPDTYEISNTSDNLEPNSGSGSGSEDEGFRTDEDDDDDEDACAEATVLDKVTPTIIVGPDTTDIGSNNNETIVDDSSAEKLSSMSLLTLCFVAFGIFFTSGSRHYL